jgi:hypothetical protein
VHPKSYSLYVLVFPKGQAPLLLDAQRDDDVKALLDHPNLAGVGAVFGGAPPVTSNPLSSHLCPSRVSARLPRMAGRDAFDGVGCANCQTREPLNVTVDVSAKLAALGLGRNEADLVVLVTDELRALVPFEETPLPAPKLMGPYFADSASLRRDAGAPAEVDALQRLLQLLGYYGDALDGSFGPMTDAAVKAFQRFGLLEADGSAGPLTKAALLRRRHDLHPDPVVQEGDKETYPRGGRVRYWVGTGPGYMPRAALLNEIGSAFTQWGAAYRAARAEPAVRSSLSARPAIRRPTLRASRRRCGLRFSRVRKADRATADIQISWSDHSDENVLVFDGPGGLLARADEKMISFDSSERWLLRGQADDWSSGQTTFRLLPVLLHEIGHTLGLVHSDNPAVVMAPYYVAERDTLTAADVARVGALYGHTAPAAEAEAEVQGSAAAVAEAAALRDSLTPSLSGDALVSALAADAPLATGDLSRAISSIRTGLNSGGGRANPSASSRPPTAQ